MMHPDSRPLGHGHTAVRPVGISLGDPAGIGPEIVVRALAERPHAPVLVFGERTLLDAASRVTGAPPVDPRRIREVIHAVPGPPSASQPEPQVSPGLPNLRSAYAQMAYLEAATQAALSGEIRALCTAPISKTWIARAGFRFPGHTEFLAARCGTTEFAMMLAGPRLRVVLATTHLALREVPLQLAPADVARAAVLAARALVDNFGVGRARVAVAGLNPHAGESGRFGDEESRIVEPGIELARAQLSAAGWPATVTGPYPPDAIFRAASLGAYDAVVALYHDQGLIPVKLLHFDEAVNITLGLPFVRTSPDHGTAYGLAGTGQANPASFLAALDLALDLSGRGS
jgi:4-hydroxythreonine-4-phosphate dehydrogenase